MMFCIMKLQQFSVVSRSLYLEKRYFVIIISIVHQNTNTMLRSRNVSR